ncbi:MAG: type II toxin-antitoxin system VapC family toxin [Lachnospiraceae bacterium]|nr:type II toxin-antitoxin system VapC family toxin [Lachnospiraceae bacterium]
MRYMLDTNICIFLIKHKPESVIKKFMQYEPNEICISSITYAELVHGVEKSQAKEKNRLALTLFLSEIEIIAFDDLAAQIYGEIKADLQRKGTPIGPLDTLIAAHAKSLNYILVTNNTREFARVEGLRLEDWVAC